MSLNVVSLNTTQTSSIHVPTEVVLHVIAQLDPQADKKTLCACALIGSSFREDAQKYIFASMKLTGRIMPGADTLSLEGLVHTFTSSESSALESILQSQRLASYVHELKLTIDKGYGVYSPDMLSGKHSFFSVFQKFRHLTKLSLASIVSGGRGVYWGELGPRTQEAFYSLFKTNPVRIISLGGAIRVPFDILNNCSTLRELSISALLSMAEDTVSDKTPTRALSGGIPLSSLKFQSSDDAQNISIIEKILQQVQSGTCPVSLSTLKTFTLHPPFDGFKTRLMTLVSATLSVCAATLTHLTFPVPSEGRLRAVRISHSPTEANSIYPILDLSGLTSLCYLKITCATMEGHQSLVRRNGQVVREDQIDSCLPWICVMLSTLPQHSARTHFDFKLRLQVINVVPQSIEQLPWKNLVEPLLATAGSKQHKALSMFVRNKPYSKSLVQKLGVNDHMATSFQTLYENPALQMLGGMVHIEAVKKVNGLPGKYILNIDW